MSYDIGPRIGIEGEKEFRNAVRQINATLKAQVAEMKAITSSYGKNSKSMSALTSKNKVLNKQIETQKKKLEQLNNGLEKSTEKYGESDTKTQRWQQTVNKATADLNNMETELQENEKAIKNYNRAQIEGFKSSEQFTKAQEKLKTGFEAVKKAAVVTATAIGTAMVGSAKAAIDYESAFTGVVKTVDATDAQLEKLSDGIRDMSKEIPTSAADISAIAESAGQLGIQTDNILGFTRTIADLGVATNLTGEEAASSLAKFANITQMSQADFDRLGSTVVALGNNLATTEADVVNMGLRLAGAGEQIGLSEAQILSFAGALSSVGIEAEAGGSAFSKVMVNMQLATETGGAALENFAQVAGMSADEFSTAFKDDAASALIAFIEGLGKSEERGLSAIKVLDDMGISEVRMRDALLRASSAGDLFSESLGVGTEAWKENTALSKEAQERYDTVSSKLKILKNTLVDVGIQIGEQLLPVISDWIEKLKQVDTQPIVDGFTWLIDNASTIVSVIVGIGAGMLAWNVVTTIQSVIGAIKAWKVATEGMAASQKILNLVMAANPVGIIITVIAALVAAIVVLWNTNDGFREALSGFFNDVGQWFSNLWTTISEFFVNLWTTISEWFSNTINSITTWFSNLISSVGGWFSNLWGSITGWFSNLWASISGWLSTTLSNIGTWFSNLWGSMTGWLSDLWSNVSNWFTGLWDKLVGIGENIINGIWQGLKNAWESVKTWFNNVWDNLFGNKTANVTINKNVTGGVDDSLAKGLDYVPFDGFTAELHKGEMVVPAKFAKMLRKIGSGVSTNFRTSSIGATGGDGRITESPIVQNLSVYSPTPLAPSQVARESKNALRRLAWAK